MAQSPKEPPKAPTQVVVTTGHGPKAKTQPTFEPSGGLKPAPAAAGTTGPKIAAPSVNYNAGQETPGNLRLPHQASPAGLYSNQALLDQQAQQAQDKAGA